MRIFKLCLLVTILSALAWAEPVARVDSLYGKENLQINKAGANAWYRSHLEQNGEIGDRFRTDEQSMASLRFLLGGKANLGKACTVQIVTDRELDVVKEGIYLEKGTIWATINEQEEKKEIKIKTAGGVMGIRGTEFVVQVDDTGFTKLSLLEGEVMVEPVLGEKVRARRGNEVTFGPDTPTLARLYELTELRARLKEDLGPAFEQLQQDLTELRNELRDTRIVARQAALQAKTQAQDARVFVLAGTHTAKEALREAGLLDSSPRDDLESSGDKLARLDELLGQTTAADAPELPDLVLSPHPHLSWQLENGDRYAVMFLHPEEEDPIYWLDETEEREYTHPADAEPLSPGSYRFRIIPLDTEGTVAGEALEGSFRVIDKPDM